SRRALLRIVSDEAAEQTRQVHGDMILFHAAVIDDPGYTIAFEQHVVVPYVAQARPNRDRHVCPRPERLAARLEEARQTRVGTLPPVTNGRIVAGRKRWSPTRLEEVLPVA